MAPESPVLHDRIFNAIDQLRRVVANLCDRQTRTEEQLGALRRELNEKEKASNRRTTITLTIVIPVITIFEYFVIKGLGL